MHIPTIQTKRIKLASNNAATAHTHRIGKPSSSSSSTTSALCSAVSSLMLCCGLCGNMSKRDYKVATTSDGGIELEPLGGGGLLSDKENLTNGGNKAGKWNICSSI